MNCNRCEIRTAVLKCFNCEDNTYLCNSCSDYIHTLNTSQSKHKVEKLIPMTFNNSNMNSNSYKQTCNFNDNFHYKASEAFEQTGRINTLKPSETSSKRYESIESRLNTQSFKIDYDKINNPNYEEVEINPIKVNNITSRLSQAETNFSPIGYSNNYNNIKNNNSINDLTNNTYLQQQYSSRTDMTKLPSNLNEIKATQFDIQNNIEEINSNIFKINNRTTEQNEQDKQKFYSQEKFKRELQEADLKQQNLKRDKERRDENQYIIQLKRLYETEISELNSRNQSLGQIISEMKSSYESKLNQFEEMLIEKNQKFEQNYEELEKNFMEKEAKIIAERENKIQYLNICLDDLNLKNKELSQNYHEIDFTFKSFKVYSDEKEKNYKHLLEKKDIEIKELKTYIEKKVKILEDKSKDELLSAGKSNDKAIQK